MNSPSNATAYTPTKATPPAPAQTQFLRRGLRPTDDNPAMTPTASEPVPAAAGFNPNEPFGTLAQLPLVVQAAFRRKLVEIMAIQLGIVMSVVGVLENSADHWLETSIVENTTAAVLLGVAVLVLLVLLHCVRAKFPLNWVVLAAMTGVLAVGLAAADVALASRVVHLNCLFTFCFTLGMVATAAWTRPREARYRLCYCGGMTFGWNAPAAPLDDDQPRELASPFLTGAVAFVVASAVVAAIELVNLATTGGTSLTRTEMLVTLLVQLVTCFWLLHQIDAMHRKMTPDAYMSGVVYLYSDLAALAALALAALLCAAVSQGDASGAALCASCYPYTYGAATVAQNSTDDDEQA